MCNLIKSLTVHSLASGSIYLSFFSDSIVGKAAYEPFLKKELQYLQGIFPEKVNSALAQMQLF